MVKTQILYKDGDRYEGEVNSKGEMHGYGTYTFKNGSYFKGNFSENQYQGKGELLDKPNNIKIVGTFKNNKACGEATILYGDGSIYKGSVQQGMREGQGQMTFPKDHMYLEYVGTFKQDRFEGQGLLKFSNGNQYKGYFMNQVFHGRGQYKTKQFVYKGDFHLGRIEGSGTLKYSNGDEYTGQFKFNKKNGQGTMLYADGSSYEGQWKEDMRHGTGIYRISKQSYYEGEFQEDQYQGQGKYVTPESVSVGQFSGSKLNGEATVTLTATNTVLRGRFKDNKKDGLFQITRQIDGKTVRCEGRFRQDKQPINLTYSSRI